MSFIFEQLVNTSLSNRFLDNFATLLQGGYDMIVIDDDAVPLSSGMVRNYYLLTVCTILMVAIFAVVLSWAIKRRRLSLRLLELRAVNGNEDKSLPFSIREIKDEIVSEETIQAATFL